MFLIVGYFLLISIEIVTANSGRKKSVYQKDLSDICKRRIVSSVFLGTGVLETDSETLDFSRLELPYDCFVKVKAEPGSNIILVAQIASTEDLVGTCNSKPNQFLVLDMMSTYGGYWEMLAVDFSTPEYRQPRPKSTWHLHNYHTPEEVSFEAQDFKTEVSIATKMARQYIFESTSPKNVANQKPTRTVHEQTQALNTTEKTDFRNMYSSDQNKFNNNKTFKDHNIFTDDKKVSIEVNFPSKNKFSEEQDDFIENDSVENDSEDNDSKTDDVDSGTDEEEQESLEEKLKIPVFKPRSSKWTAPATNNMRTPHLYETPRPYIHFAPRYKNISPKRPKTRDDLEDGRLDYLWWHEKPMRKSTKLSRWRTYPTFMGYGAWQRQHGSQPPNKYVNYDDVEDKRKSVRKKPSSPEQYFFNADEDRKRITPDFQKLSLSTRLRYFQDGGVTKSMIWTTPSKQRFVNNKAPHFRLKSTTANHTKLLKIKTLNAAKKDSIHSTKTTTKDEKHKFSFVRNQKNKTIIRVAPTSSNGYHKTNISGNTTLLNKIENAGNKARKNTTNAENSTSVTVSNETSGPLQTKLKIAKTKMHAISHLTINTRMLTEITPTKDIGLHFTVSNQRSPLAAKPTKSIKYNTEGSKTTITTKNEHDYLNLLLSNFRRNAEVGDVPKTKNTAANISNTVLASAEVKTLEPLSKLTVNLPTMKRTSVKLTSIIDHILNETAAVSTTTAVIFNTSTEGALEPTKQAHFNTTNKTPSPTFTTSSLHKYLEKTLPSTSLLKSISSVSTINETINTTTEDNGMVSLSKIEELGRTIPITNTLNTRPADATLNSTKKQSDLILIVTKSNIQTLKQISSVEATANVTIIKETFTKTAHTQATSQNYQETELIQEINKLSTTLTTKQPNTKINKDSIGTTPLLDVVVNLDILETSTKALQKDKEKERHNVIPLAVTSSLNNISTSSKNRIFMTFDNATNVTQKTPRTAIDQIASPVTKPNETHKNVSATTFQEFKITFKETDTKLTQAKMFVVALLSTTRKSAVFSDGVNVTGIKPQHVTLFSAESWNKSTLAYKSWENLIQAAPDMVSSLNRTKHIWKATLKKPKSPNARKRLKRRLEYIPIEDSMPHTQEILPTTSSRTSRRAPHYMDVYLADDQKEEDFGRAHFGRLESNLGPVIYNICRTETKKTRLVALFNTSTIIFIMNDFNLERLNLIITSATTIAQTHSQCPQNQLECQVSGVRVCIDMSSACDHIPNCGANDIYDEDRILCGFRVTFKHSLVLTAVTFIAMISIGIYSVHYWLERCIPHVSEAFFVYTDTVENVLHLDTIMRSPNATDESSPLKYHVPEFEKELRMRNRMVKRGLCSLLFRKLCPCCKVFKTTAEAPISLEEFDRDHSDTGSHFEKMFQNSADDMDGFRTHQDDKATQTSFTLLALKRDVSFHNRSGDSLINKLGDLRNSHSYHNEIELIKKMKDNAEIKKRGPAFPQDDLTSTPSIKTQRVTAEEEELRNTMYDMSISVPMTPVLLSDEIIGQPEEEIEALVEPTKRLRFNEQEAGPSDLQDNKAKKAAIDSKRMTSVDLNKKKNNAKFFKSLEKDN